MYIGYVLGDNTLPLLKQVSELEVKSLTGDKPTLIVGYSNAVKLFPQLAKVNSRIIDKKKQIYYSYSREESESSYSTQTVKFLKRTFAAIVKGTSVVSIINPDKIDIEKLKGQPVFLYETEKLITVSTAKVVYYFNKEISTFFSKGALTSEVLAELLDQCDVWSWDRFKFFGALLKSNHCYKSKDQLRHLLAPYGDIELFMGAFCVNWMKELDHNGFEKTWQRAYEVETYISSLPIKIDRKLVTAYSYTSDNDLFATLLKCEDEGYIYQKYNGTDKTTGRMFAIDSGYSVQTLSKNIRNIIIAEPNCYLVEFDFKYFEHKLLQQLCKVPLKGDPHKSLSIALFGSDQFRDIAKGINYSTIYGKSLESTVKDLLKEHKLALSEQELLKRLKELTEPAKKLEARLQKEFKRDGYIINPFGRPVVSEKTYALVNNYVQSTASDLVIIKILKIRTYLKQYNTLNRIILQNHDSILFNLRISDVEETSIAQDLKLILEEPEMDLSGKVSIKHGFNWKDMD